MMFTNRDKSEHESFIVNHESIINSKIRIFDDKVYIINNKINERKVGVQRFDVALGLRALQDRERIAGVRNRRRCLVVGGDDERQRRVRPPLVILARRVEISRPDAVK